MFGTREWYLGRFQPLFSPDGDGDGGGGDGGDDPLATLDEKGQAAVKARVDAAAAAARKESERIARDLQTKLTAIENSGKSEADKTAARLKALEDDNAAKDKAIRERDAKDAVRDAATKAGASNADVVYRAVKSDIEFDDDGTPKNVATLVKDLKELAPQLFRPATGKADAGAGNGGKPKNFDMNAQIRQMAGRGT